MPDDMPELMQAQTAYDHAPKDARLLIARRRALLGRAVVAERERGTTQEVIARRLKKTREQVRRYQVAYERWEHDYPGESLDD